MIYVDNNKVRRYGKEWSHMIADSTAELHEFAAVLQLPRSWFHAASKYPHYDITSQVRLRAITLGAQAVSTREVLVRAKALALRPPTYLTTSSEIRQLVLFD